MADLSEERPAEYPYPTIWHRFEIESEGKIRKFRIQDATMDMSSDIFEFLKTHFVAEEPMMSSQNIVNDVASMEELRVFWGHEILGGVFLVCLEEFENSDRPDLVVGCNVTTIKYKGTHNRLGWSRGLFKMLEKIVTHIKDEKFIFDKFGVDKYLNSYGLSVHKEYRKMGISGQIMKAREILCRAMKVPLTVGIFTSAHGKASARRAGYKTLDLQNMSDIHNECAKVPGMTKVEFELMYFKYE